MDLNKMVVESLKEMDENGAVKSIIQEQVSETVSSVTRDLFGRHSEFSRNLKKHVSEALQINFKEFDLKTYNHMIMESIKGMLDDQLNNEGIEKVKEQLETLLADGKREYILSELIEELAGESDEAKELEYHGYHTMTLHIDESFGSLFIYMDSREDIDEYECKYRLFVSHTGQIASITVGGKEHGRPGSENFDLKYVQKGLYGLEQTLFKMFVNGAKLIVDEDDCELNISNPEFV